MSDAYLELNGYKVYLPYNPNNTYWNYDLNRQVIDTYGGRVIQLLSVSTGGMNLEGEAGSRPKLLQLFNDYKSMQDTQIQLKTAANLFIPTSFAEKGSINHKVWLSNMDIAISRNSVTYPYRIALEIQEQLSNEFVANTIKDLIHDFNWIKKDGVGFVRGGYYQGINSDQVSVSTLSSYIYGRSVG